MYGHTNLERGVIRVLFVARTHEKRARAQMRIRKYAHASIR